MAETPRAFAERRGEPQGRRSRRHSTCIAPSHSTSRAIGPTRLQLASKRAVSGGRCSHTSGAIAVAAADGRSSSSSASVSATTPVHDATPQAKLRRDPVARAHEKLVQISAWIRQTHPYHLPLQKCQQRCRQWLVRPIQPPSSDL